MSTRGRGSSGRGRGRRGRAQSDARFAPTQDEVPSTGLPTSAFNSEESIPPPECEEHLLTPNNEVEQDGQSSEGQNSSHGRTRGETHGSHAPNNRDSRTFIQPDHDGFIPGIVPCRIMDILRMYMGPWPTWEQVPLDKKEFLYEKFREHFMWQPEHEAGIRHSWEQTHKRNFKNIIYRCKKKVIKEASVDDPMDIQKIVPKNMQTSDWEKICTTHMSSPSYQKRCKKVRQNRLTEKDGSITKHTGGSISFAKHAKRMEAQSGRPVTQTELHERTHRKAQRKGEYIDNKSERVHDEYYQEYVSQHGSNPFLESSFDAKKWLEISGGPCKGRVYGFGNTYIYHELIVADNSFESPSEASSPAYITQDQLQDAIAKAIDQELVKEREAAAAREVIIMEEAMRARDEAKKIAEGAKTRYEALMRTLGVMMEKLNGIESSSSSRNEGNGGGKDK